MRTKLSIIVTALFAMCALAPAASFAGLITAKVDNWTRHSTTISTPGFGSRSGGALFDMTLISGTGLPGLGVNSKFLAMCIEPWQSVGRGTYQWDLVDLAVAPSNGLRAPMGQEGVNSILDALAYLGNAGFYEFNQAEQNAFQAVAWLASNPGSQIGGLTADEDALMHAMLGYDASDPELARISVAALLNRGTNGRGNGQDLIVYGYRSTPPSPPGSVPLPATLPLLVGGLLGMARVRRIRRA